MTGVELDSARREVAAQSASISVVISCYEQAGFLLEMLPRLIQELRAHDEVLVCDDGSSVHSVERLAHAFAHESRIRVVRSAPTKSVSRTRNRGFRAARGAWVAFLDGDDEFVEGWRTRIGEGLEAIADADVLFTDYWLWTPDRPSREPERALMRYRMLDPLQALAVRRAGDWQELDSARLGELMLHTRVPLHTSSVVYRREWLQQRDVWHDPRFRVAEDTDFQLRAVQGARVGSLPAPNSRYRITRTGLAAQADARTAMNRHLQRYSMLQLPAARFGSTAEVAVWRRVALSERILAEALLREGEPQAALRYALRSFMALPERKTLAVVHRAFWAQFRRVDYQSSSE